MLEDCKGPEVRDDKGRNGGKKYRYMPGQNKENCFFLLQIHELQYGPDVLLQTVITCF
jgi:hypothetical protein